MKSSTHLTELAQQCERRSKEVASAGDRAQLLQISLQLKQMAEREGSSADINSRSVSVEIVEREAATAR